MYTQFFGNYLLSQGYVTREQLFAAMKRQSSEHTRLGTLAIHAGYMTASEVDKTIIQQTHQDEKFGELAIRLGYLTKGQVMELLKSQSPDFLLLGQVLVDQGTLTNSELEKIIQDYRVQNAMEDLDMTKDNSSTIEKLFQNYLVHSDESVTALGSMYLELLFNNFIRFVGEEFTPMAPKQITSYSSKCCVSQKVLGDYSVVSYIDADEKTAIEFASRYVGDQYTEYDEYVQASLDDFLNLHNGLFIVNVSNNESIELSITAPVHHDNSELQFENKTYLFPIIFSFGTVNYIVEIVKIIK